MRRFGGGANVLQTPGGPESTARKAATPARKPGTLVHGGYWLLRILRSGAPSRRSAVGRRFEQRRLAYAMAKGFPSWAACPAPLQAAIDNVIRQEFFTAALFSGFWTQGVEGVARHYLTAAEALRRQLSDIGLEPVSVAGEPLAAYLKRTYGTNAP
jgi:hypothetical protein